MRDPFERRGRDLNPRRSFHHVRDFQSRSLGHSDTSPGASRVAGRPLRPVVVDVSPASPAWAGPGRRATRPGLRRASPRDRAEHRWRSSSGAASGARLSAGSGSGPATASSPVAPGGARPSAPASWRGSRPHAGVAAEARDHGACQHDERDEHDDEPGWLAPVEQRRDDDSRTRPPPSPPRSSRCSLAARQPPILNRCCPRSEVDCGRIGRPRYGYGLQRIEAATAAAPRSAPSAASIHVISVGCRCVATSFGSSAKTSRS